MPTGERMIERQAMLADFGEFALRSDDLQKVLDESCRLVVRALEADLAKILEIQPGGETVLVRAGIGWRPGIVGCKTLEMKDRTSEAFSIAAGKPIATEDIHREDRFVFPDFMIDHEIVSIVNAPVFLPGGERYGLLQVDSKTPRDFGEQDMEFLRTYATILGPVIDRLHKIRDLDKALEEKQRMLNEMQHRVRNNFAAVGSLIRMRVRQTAPSEAAAELAAVGERIETLRLVHDQLYVSGSIDQLRLEPYVTTVVENLRDLHEAESGPVQLDLAIDEVSVRPETAVPLGLIVNEFMTNSLRYAFDGQGGQITVRIEVLEGGPIRVRLSDDGKGLPTDLPPASLPPASPGRGTGINLIGALAHQIGAQPEWSSSDGTELRFEFTSR